MFRFKSKLLLAYGYDISGEVQEGVGSKADQTHLEDTQEPWTHHETGPNPINVTRDSEAEEEFPEIVRKPNRFPSRSK